MVSGKAKAGDIVFGIRKDKELGKEGYDIRISDRVVVTAPQPIGVYWATRTLLQMADQTENQTLPRGEIRDYP